MSAVKIIVRKSKGELYVYKGSGSTPIYKAKAVHGGAAKTSNGRRTIKHWVWGAVSFRYAPNTWFSYGATFKGWPPVGDFGVITKHGRKWHVFRQSATAGLIWYDGGKGGGAASPGSLTSSGWYPIWKDQNPFGVVMADLTPGRIELHGTGKDPRGADTFPPVTHGCVRTHNKSILKIKSLAPAGSIVEITT
jgi:hypothetical protein